MNNLIPGVAPSDQQVFVARQKEMIANIKKEIANSEQAIKEKLRLQDALYLKLFPPVRPDRDPQLISALIEEKKSELEQLRTILQAHDTPEDGRQVDDDHETPNGQRNRSQMRKDCVDLHSSLEHLRSLLSPIRRLPMEILGEIFHLACTYLPMQDSISLSSAPLLVTHVCSTWRSVAISKTSLWSFIAVRIADPVPNASEGLLFLVALWLQRSGTSPLRLLIKCEVEENQHREHNFYLRLLDSLAPHFLRWKDVIFDNAYFQLPNTRWFPHLPDDASFPMMESFTLRTGHLKRKEVQKITRILHASPNLRHVSWLIKSTLKVPPHPYGQLTTLELGGIYTLEDSLIILESGRHLRSFNICLYIPVGIVDGQGLFHVRHECLEKAYFACSGDSSILLDLLTLSNLKHLSLDKLPAFGLHVGDAPWSQVSFLEFLRRSKCSLTSLSVLDFDIPPDDVLVMLHHLSASLTKFGMENVKSVCITDAVLQALTIPTLSCSAAGKNEDGASTSSIPAILCPKLRYLKLFGCIGSSEGILADMVESRCSLSPHVPGLAQLEVGNFGVNFPPSAEDQRRLRALHKNLIDYTALM